jgi:nucleoside-diphosphate-sugar epimerase
VQDLILVTGAAGFIGSHVAERLLARGERVRGVDAFIDYYPRERKEANLAPLLGQARFQLVEVDLARADPAPLLEGVGAVCHLAAQAGVRASWGTSFRVYLDCNVLATQRLLEAARDAHLVRFVCASSSSVYGETDDLPMREDGRACPVSPYGVTKLAAEHLAVLYQRSYGIPTVSLRYFTVYGPRQRPDMAFHRFIAAALAGEPVTIYGDGEQSRDFTYIDDIVDGTLRALDEGPPGEVINLGGGSSATLNRALSIIEGALGVEIERRHEPRARGDVRDTLAENLRARSLLGFSPAVPLEEGLPAQCDWQRALASAKRGSRADGGT